jgi:hypothetical protein
MIRNVLMISSSGLVVFSRQFSDGVRQVCVDVMDLWCDAAPRRALALSMLAHCGVL